MADLFYLIEREREEELRVSKRQLTFPDGSAERIETYRLVWQWFDRLLDCPYTFDEDEILAMVPRCAAHEGISLNEAMVRVVSVLVGRLERDAIDVTDDTLQLSVARGQMEKWNARTARRHSERR